MKSRIGWMAALAAVALQAGAAGGAAPPRTSAGAAPAGDATGTWHAKAESMRGPPMEYVIVLQQDKNKLSGTLTTAGKPSEIANGKIAGDTVSFTVNFVFGPGAPPVAIKYTGKLIGDAMPLASTMQMGMGPPTVTKFVALRGE